MIALKKALQRLLLIQIVVVRYLAMAKFRKRPVIIEAEQFVVYRPDDKVLTKVVNGVNYPVYKDEKGHHILIPTLEGTMRCDNLDWIIKGVSGEYYPCKPDIFEKTYESVG